MLKGIEDAISKLIKPSGMCECNNSKCYERILGSLMRELRKHELWPIPTVHPRSRTGSPAPPYSLVDVLELHSVCADGGEDVRIQLASDVETAFEAVKGLKLEDCNLSTSVGGIKRKRDTHD